MQNFSSSATTLTSESSCRRWNPDCEVARNESNNSKVHFESPRSEVRSNGRSISKRFVKLELKIKERKFQVERIKDAVRQRNMRRQNMPQASNNFNLIIYKQASPIDTK